MLDEVEHALASHPVFGDSTYISDQLGSSLRCALRELGLQLPSAQRLAQALRDGTRDQSLVEDTVLRCATMRAARHAVGAPTFDLSLGECVAVYDEVVRHLDAGRPGSPIQDGSLRSLQLRGTQSLIWSEAHSNDIFGQTFRRVVSNNYEALPAEPTDADFDMLRQGAALLANLLPELAPPTVAHATMVALVPSLGKWSGVASSSQIMLSGTVFLNRGLHDPWIVAEHLFHEALHQKLYALQVTHSVREWDVPDQTARIITPWNSRKLAAANRWDTHRALAAFHVYVHLALLSLRASALSAELSERYGPPTLISPRTALNRAQYLGARLRDVCWAELGAAGQGLVEWLHAALKLLDDDPPGPQDDLHLYVDRYRRETAEIDRLLPEVGRVPGRAATLTAAVRQDLAVMREVALAVGDNESLDALRAAYDSVQLAHDSSSITAARRAVLSTFARCAVSPYALGLSESVNLSVQDMFELSSDLWAACKESIPRRVAESMHCANVLQFRYSCAGEVGRMLSVLAASAPTGARILEVGTGSGVGLAWIVSGLAERTDVEVTSCEVDPALLADLASRQWPDFVRIIDADGTTVLAEASGYWLIFLDAASVKYSVSHSFLDRIRPGSLLVLDDMAREDGAEDDLDQRADLVDQLRSRPDFTVAELEYATGLVLCAKNG
jgi:predicted O-methyltransferase YrrM